MKRQLFFWAPLACIATGALLLTSCSTISSRIEANQNAFAQLSPQDQALIREGKIRGGMSQEAVYMAWGNPQQKATGMVRNTATETWVYTASTAAWGLSPLQDQQLAGLIMWIPAGAVYLIAAGILFTAWLRAAERRAQRAQRYPRGRPSPPPLEVENPAAARPSARQ